MASGGADEQSMLDFLNPGNTALVVTGIMLPVTGAVVRWVAFLDRFSHPARMAVTLPAAELALAGIVPVLATLALLGIAAFLSPAVGERTKHLWPFILGLALLLVLGGLLGGLFVWLIYVPFGVIGYFLITRLPHEKKLSSPLVAALLIVAFVLAGLATGMRFTPSAPGAYTFEPGANAVDGPYLRVAEDSDSVFLAPCSQSGVVVEVPTSKVRSVTWQGARSNWLPFTDVNSALDVLRRADVYEGCNS
jgi:hypothetical protein